MVCLRCGYCCINHDVVIIRPEHIENFNIKDQTHFMLKEGGVECPHLSWDGKKTICDIHNYPWYKKTPCYSHGQIEQSKYCDCRMGEFLAKRKELI